MPVHGTKRMPIWGNLFWYISQGHQSEVRLRLAGISYLNRQNSVLNGSYRGWHIARRWWLTIPRAG